MRVYLVILLLLFLLLLIIIVNSLFLSLFIFNIMLIVLEKEDKRDFFCVLGVLLGVYVGDSLGVMLEFMFWEEI